MFTNNYINYRYMMFFNTSYYLTDIDGAQPIACQPQYSYSTDFGYHMSGCHCRAISTSYLGVYFGSGTTPPTRADYKLESLITTGLTLSSQGPVLRDRGNGTYEISSAYTVMNNNAEGGESITIGEMGYFGKCGASSSSAKMYLFERQVLPVPIVLAPGERKLITYKITINQIFNVD